MAAATSGAWRESQFPILESVVFIGSTPAQAAEFIHAESERNAKVIKAAKIPLQE